LTAAKRERFAQRSSQFQFSRLVLAHLSTFKANPFGSLI
jgi:hypothetical protein